MSLLSDSKEVYKIIIESKYPYDEYLTYLIKNREDRNIVCLYDKGKRLTLSYARWLMSTHLGRILEKDEQVDHINNDKTDDRIENLQILSPKDNVDKYNASTKGKRFILLECPICKKIFEREYHDTFERKGSKFHCCSKTCLHQFLKGGHTNEELVQVGKNQILDTYYRNKVIY